MEGLAALLGYFSFYLSTATGYLFAYSALIFLFLKRIHSTICKSQPKMFLFLIIFSFFTIGPASCLGEYCTFVASSRQFDQTFWHKHRCHNPWIHLSSNRWGSHSPSKASWHPPKNNRTSSKKTLFMIIKNAFVTEKQWYFLK